MSRQERQHGSDASVLEELGRRLAGQRLERNWTQAELAREAGVSKRTLVRLEGGESTQLTNLVRVLRALGLLARLDALAPPSAIRPLEQLRGRARRRRRASPRGAATVERGGWVWADGAHGQPEDGA